MGPGSAPRRRFAPPRLARDDVEREVRAESSSESAPEQMIVDRDCVSPSVIASAARQSRISPRKQSGLLRFARNDARCDISQVKDTMDSATTERTHARILAACLARALLIVAALIRSEGAGNARRRPHPWPACEKMQAAGTTGSAETSRHSPRDGLNAYTQSPWCAGLVGHHPHAKRSFVVS